MAHAGNEHQQEVSHFEWQVRYIPAYNLQKCFVRKCSEYAVLNYCVNTVNMPDIKGPCC